MIYIDKEEQFKELINKKLVIVDFYATWCGPCQMISPILEEMEKETPDLTVVKIDVDKHEKLAREHGVFSIPTLEIYKNCVMTSQVVGYKTKKELEDLLQ